MKIGRCLALAALAGVALAESASAQVVTGPSTTTEPYIVPVTEGVSATSILTVDDSVGGYRMVGIPDGLGAFYSSAREAGKTFNLVAHHEAGSTAGVVRAHGSKGALVSRWTIDKTNLKVLTGRDQIKSPSTLFLWNGSSYVAGTTAFERFCSADLAGPGAFIAGQLGTPQRIFLGGEETSPPFSNDYGRVWAHVATGPNDGTTYQLPRFGKHSNENVIASPFSQQKTVVAIGDDAGTATTVTKANICRTAGQTGCLSPPSEVFVYVGTKQSTGNEVERAGLTNGKLYGVRVKVNGTVVAGESKEFVFSAVAPAVTSARFELVDLGDVANKTGLELQDVAIDSQVTQFIRVEDGAWDPRQSKQNDFYFVTTGNISTAAATWLPSRLWRMRFDNISAPEAGGTIEMLLTNAFYPGAATTPNDDPNYQMFDNIGIDTLGRILLTEDPGGNARLSRIYAYGIDTGELVEVARANAKFFGGTAGTNPTFLTNNEEGSGIIDASAFLGAGAFLLSVQNHAASADPELIEGGQLMALFIDPSIAR